MQVQLSHLDEAFLLVSMIADTGGPGFGISLQHHNLFYSNGIGQILNERMRPIAVSMCDTYSAEIKFYDHQVHKPVTVDGRPMMPLEAIQTEGSYLGQVDCMITIIIYKYGKVIHQETDRINLFKIPITIMSNCCNLINTKPGQTITASEYGQLARMAMKEHPGELFGYDTGLTILMGNIYSTYISKDMNRNNLFYNFNEPSSDRLYQKEVLANILCNTPGANAINIIFEFQQTKDNIDIIWKINSTPLNILFLPMVVMFNILDIFRTGQIASLILRYVVNETRDRAATLLKEIFETSNPHLSNISQVYEYLNNICQATDIKSRLQNLRSTEITPEKIYNIFYSRIFPHLPRSEGNRIIIHFAARTIADIVQKILLIRYPNPVNYQKTININLRRSHQEAIIYTPNHHNKKQLTSGLYNNLFRYLQTYLKSMVDRLHEQEADGTLTKKAFLPNIIKLIKSTDLTSQISGITTTRKNIKGEMVVESIKRSISGSSGPIGRYGKSVAMNAFMVYSTESSNIKFRYNAFDSSPHNCLLSTAEGDPGKTSMPTGTVVSSVVYYSPQEIRSMLNEELHFCSHKNCTQVHLEGVYMGMTCNPRIMIECIRELRRKNKKMRYICMIYKQDTDVLKISYTEGILFMPMLRVQSNFEEYSKSLRKDPNNPIEFKQDILLTKDHILEMARDAITIENLYEEGIIEFVSSLELSNLFLFAGIDDLYANKNNPLRIGDYVVLSSQMVDVIMGSNPSLDNAPGQRCTFAWSQSKGCIELGNPAITRQKRSMFLADADIPMAMTALTPIGPNYSINVPIALMSNEHSQEDGVVINSHAVGRNIGKAHCVSKITKRLEVHEQLCTKSEVPNAPEYFDDIGLPKIGTIMQHNTIYMITKSNVQKTTNTMHTFNYYITAIVSNYNIHMQQNGGMTVIIEYLFDLPMGESSKISELTGNKSVISKCLSPYELPKTLTGITPVIIQAYIMTNKRSIHDNIVNINAFHTSETGRFLVYKHGMQKEIILPSDEYMKIHKINKDGSCPMITKNHTRMINDIIMMYKPIRRLEKQGSLESYHTTRPSINITTYQPHRGGRSKNGSFANGEMARHLHVMCGATTYLTSTVSDQINLPICSHCNEVCINHATMGIFCQNCHLPHYNMVPTTMSFKMLIDRMNANNINTYIVTRGPSFDDVTPKALSAKSKPAKSGTLKE